MDGLEEFTANRSHAAGRRLTVGVWPGSALKHNKFPAIFAQSLRDAGCTVVDVSDPATVKQKLDILHIHWPEQVFWRAQGHVAKAISCFKTYYAIWSMQRRGTKLVWMVHNLRPHDRGGIRARIWPYIERYVRNRSDGFMTLAPSTIEVVRQAFPELRARPATAAFHPAYPPNANLPEQRICREKLSLPPEGTIFALLGLLRPYKGAESLIAAFKQSKARDCRLVIAGNPITPEYGAQLQALAAGDPRIEVRLGYLSDDDFALFMEACDGMVLPYQGYLHSGALIHALSCGRAVITPSSPFAEDLAQSVGADWVVCYPGALTPEIFETWSKPRNPPNLTALDPRELGLAAAALYQQLV